MRRVVTDSMLGKLISHLRKRGVFTFEHSILSNTKSLESSSLVCDLCYMLIVAENELIALESKFVKILNIPIITGSAEESKPNSTISDDTFT